ncbi:MAG TPA: ABC transporter ATP-binding protein [Stellaceae bacterium]|jgi:peptide/nickel transport system ATP-binding protein|nr:ABC transporter ATP-binding protein [Stellaceae bacterium]
MSDLLRIEDLHVRFDTPGGYIEAVRGVTFRMRQGSTVALVGESGSGKSVVSQSIMRILPRNGQIARGAIQFADPRSNGAVVDLAQLPADGPEMRAIRGGRISIIFQEPMSSLSPVHTIGDQVSEALRLHRTLRATEAKDLTVDMLRLVGFPDPARAWRSYPFELSGGLRQRAMIAMALVCRPALLIADEPTTALDVTIQAQILKLIVELQHELDMAVLLITHDLGVVANIAEEIVVMYHGEIMESGTLDDIFHRARHPYLKALLRAVPRFDMKPGERLMPIRDIPAGDAPHLMAQMAPWPKEATRPLLECVDIRKSFGLRGGLLGGGSGSRIIAIDGVSLQIARGECLGLVGESGCGKTTLSKILLRAVQPDAGQVIFNDRGVETDVLALEGEELKRFRRQVQFIFQDPFGSLNPRMTVYDIIAEPLVIHGIGDSRSRHEMVAELVTLVGLDRRHMRRYPHSFSGGQRQRIGIARALALRPELVICDEPVSALDVSIQAQILNLLMDLQKKLGLTYLFISHNLAVVDYIADRVAVMCAGRIVEMAGRGVLFRNPVHPYTQALLAAVPTPDPTHRLDFHRLMEGRASDPCAWPEPFRREPGRPIELIEVEPGHFVEATAMPIAAAAREVSLAAPG